MRRFLHFIVEKTLAGEGAALKEYLIGVEVFDGGPDFDPRSDTIVRVEAGRLRKKLREYYEGAGSLDPLMISVPHGRYVPALRLEGSKPIYRYQSRRLPSYCSWI